MYIFLDSYMFLGLERCSLILMTIVHNRLLKIFHWLHLWTYNHFKCTRATIKLYSVLVLLPRLTVLWLMTWKRMEHQRRILVAILVCWDYSCYHWSHCLCGTLLVWGWVHIDFPMLLNQCTYNVCSCMPYNGFITPHTWVKRLGLFAIVEK